MLFAVRAIVLVVCWGMVVLWRAVGRKHGTVLKRTVERTVTSLTDLASLYSI